MSRESTTFTLLRSLDAAPASPAQELSDRARVDLELILASRRQEGPAGPTAPRRASRLTRRLVIASGAVAAAAAALVVLPGVTGGDKAFATWTPVATSMSADALPEAAEQCSESFEDGAGEGYEDQLATATAVVSERRGVWTTVLLAGPNGFSALCITDSSTRVFGDMIGSIGTPGNYRSPGPREVNATDLGTGTMSAGDISLAAGHVGADVRGIKYVSPTHGEVTATVSGGRFAFWVPGDDLMDAASVGVDVTVTHADGSTSRTKLSLLD